RSTRISGLFSSRARSSVPVSSSRERSSVLVSSSRERSSVLVSSSRERSSVLVSSSRERSSADHREPSFRRQPVHPCLQPLGHPGVQHLVGAVGDLVQAERLLHLDGDLGGQRYVP